MLAVEKLLGCLERYDTAPPEEALELAIADALGHGDPSPMQDAARAIVYQFASTEAGVQTLTALRQFAGERLDAWHTLKANALEAAWRTCPRPMSPPGAQGGYPPVAAPDIQAMLSASLETLRRGLGEEPSLLADAHFLQGLARAGGHGFSFAAARDDLRTRDPNVPDDDTAIIVHCQVAAASLKHIVPEGAA